MPVPSFKSQNAIVEAFIVLFNIGLKLVLYKAPDEIRICLIPPFKKYAGIANELFKFINDNDLLNHIESKKIYLI